MPINLFVIFGFIFVIIVYLYFYYRMPNIERLIKIFENSEISTLEVSTLFGLKKIVLDRLTLSRSKPVAATEKKPIPEPPKRQIETIKSPMVGTFHINFETEEEPFVTLYSEVEKDDVVCIVVALQNATQVKTEFSGRVIQILVKDGNPVEFGQPLMRIELSQ